MVLNLEKIIMINSTNSLENDSSYLTDPQKWELFDLSAIEAQNRLEIVVRVNEESFKFSDISIKFIVDRDDMKVVEMRRK